MAASFLRLQTLFKDPRDFQIGYLGLFLTYGLLVLGWNADWEKYLVLFISCIGVQFLGDRFLAKKYFGWKSALISALGLSLLLQVASWEWALLAGVVAVGSKYLFRFQGKHFFNPANLGLIVAVTLGEAWISPGQWGNGALLLFGFGALASIVLWKVGRLDTTLPFFITFALLEFGRTVLYQGWGMDFYFHKLSNGSLLLFTFFMITDPVTTPKAKTPRMVWASLIGVASFLLSSQLYIHTAPIWVLFFSTPLTLLIDSIWKKENFVWLKPTTTKNPIKMKKSVLTACFFLAAMTFETVAHAFCGFYVAKADANLFNNKSEVIFVRDGKRSVVTMSSDFKGNVKDFAMVVPVPEVLEKKDIRVVSQDLFRKLDDYSAPRLVEYYDNNPCQPVYEELEAVMDMANEDMLAPISLFKREADARQYKVTIEAQYEVGEYDILILSALESSGLKNWLTDNGYKIPAKAEEVLEPYIKSDMKFFVVKVNLDRQSKSGVEALSPLQIEFESSKFMLPIRLGMANSAGEQDMIMYFFTRDGRVETTNYRTVTVPTDRNIPLYVKEGFNQFYPDVFEQAYEREGRNAIFTEYAWNVSPTWGGMKCDPCVGPPPMPQEFVNAGVNWTNQGQVFFTRLHVRYARNDFPQDLFFQVTPDKQNRQARYILTHPAQGDLSCQDGQEYLEDLKRRRKKEVDELFALTGKRGKYEENYINEFDTRLKPRYGSDKKGSFLPIIPTNNGGPSSLIYNIVFALSILLVAVYSGRLFKQLDPKKQ